MVQLTCPAGLLVTLSLFHMMDLGQYEQPMIAYSYYYSKPTRLLGCGAIAASTLQRLRARFLTNPQQFELLFNIIDDEVARNDHEHGRSCTKGLLWLKR